MFINIYCCMMASPALLKSELLRNDCPGATRVFYCSLETYALWCSHRSIDHMTVCQVAEHSLTRRTSTHQAHTMPCAIFISKITSLYGMRDVCVSCTSWDITNHTVSHSDAHSLLVHEPGIKARQVSHAAGRRNPFNKCEWELKLERSRRSVQQVKLMTEIVFFIIKI